MLPIGASAPGDWKPYMGARGLVLLFFRGFW